MVLKALVVWVALFILAFINGALREIGFKDLLGISNLPAHQFSCLTGIILWTGFTLLIWDWLGIQSRREAILVGIGWFTATMLVETFLLNRNLSWSEIIQTYNVAAGEFWGLVLLWIGFLPFVAFLLKNRR